VRAIWFAGAGGPEVIDVRDAPEPACGPSDVLVKVRAAGLNRADILQRRGFYAPPPGTKPEIPGLELAGEVAALGAAVRGFSVGDRVMAIAAGEAQAELAAVHERMLLPIPDGISFEEAGAIPEVFLTAHDALFTQGGLRSGWPVLIHAVGSGVGTAAAQLARAASATVIGTSRSPEKLEKAKPLGLDHGIAVAREGAKFADAVLALTGGEGVPVLIDFIGAAYAGENLASLATLGKMILLGSMGGLGASIDLGMVLRKRATISGSVLRGRPLEEKIAATRAVAREVLPLLAAKKVRPIVEKVLPFSEIRDAHKLMESNDTFGKIVLVP
jgi:putative PIG3 family NAD(P)H quinone oxidoreductase